jgi:hypothetical protein
MDNILNNLDSIIEEKSRERLRHVRELLVKRRIEIPSRIRIIINTNNFYFPNNSKPIIFYDKNINTIFLDGLRIKKDILEIINIYDKKYREKNKDRPSYIFVPRNYQLFSRKPTTREIYIIIPLKSSQKQSEKSSPYDSIVENYMKFVLLHGIWLSVEDIRNLKLPKETVEYIIYTVVTLSYYSTFYKNLGLSNKVIYTSLYNTIGCTDILEHTASLINEDPFTVGTCTGYHILAEYSPNEINLKNVYEELIKDPYYFLEEYLKQ